MARIARFAFCILLLVGAAVPRLAVAAQGLDNCAGMITVLPTVISTAGTWCVATDIGVTMSSGGAIAINADNVVLDCSGHTIDNDTAAASSQAVGVATTDRHNVVVRRCRFDGFYRGVYLQGLGGGGNLVEDNRFENSRYTGIELQGDDSIARRNRIFNTGGSTVSTAAVGVIASGDVDVQDNLIVGVSPSAAGNGYGVFSVNNTAGTISGNHVRGVTHDANDVSVGIWVLTHGRIAIRANDLVGDGSASSYGLLCDNAIAKGRDNVISGWATAISACGSGGGNVVRP
jgi:parallel beta-helix repeat protein